MRVEPALHETDGGVTLDVEVVPGAARDEFPAGFNPWRKRLQARVRAPASEGEANQALVELVASFFGVPSGSVWIDSGQRSRQKRIGVEGVTLAEALRRLSASGPP